MSIEPSYDIKCVICEQQSVCACHGCRGPQDNEHCADFGECTLSSSNTRCYWHEYYKELVITTA